MPPPRLLVAALVTALVLVTTACGPDEPAGPDLSRFAAPARAAG